MLELKAPPVWNGPNTGSLAPGVNKRVKKKQNTPMETIWYEMLKCDKVLLVLKISATATTFNNKIISTS